MCCSTCTSRGRQLWWARLLHTELFSGREEITHHSKHLWTVTESGVDNNWGKYCNFFPVYMQLDAFVELVSFWSCFAFLFGQNFFSAIRTVWIQNYLCGTGRKEYPSSWILSLRNRMCCIGAAQLTQKQNEPKINVKPNSESIKYIRPIQALFTFLSLWSGWVFQWSKASLLMHSNTSWTLKTKILKEAILRYTAGERLCTHIHY